MALIRHTVALMNPAKKKCTLKEACAALGVDIESEKDLSAENMAKSLRETCKGIVDARSMALEALREGITLEGKSFRDIDKGFTPFEGI